MVMALIKCVLFSLALVGIFFGVIDLIISYADINKNDKKGGGI